MTVYEISEKTGLNINMVYRRIKELGIKGQKVKYSYLYNLDQVNCIYRNSLEIVIPKVIYVTIAPSDVYQSRMNYDPNL